MQQEFQFERDEDSVAVRLAPSLGFRPDVTLTDNRVAIVSVKKYLGGAALKIHRCFACATEDVLAALVSFINRSDRRAKKIIKGFYEANRPRTLRIVKRRKRAIRSEGRHHDLIQIFNDLNLKYFGGKIVAGITWGLGRNVRRGFRRSRHITLGSYDRLRKLVIIHPNLDRENVPRFFVEAIVFHEMCHELVVGETKGGRRRIHTPAFKDMEKRFPMFVEARQWAKENIGYLLSGK